MHRVRLPTSILSPRTHLYRTTGSITSLGWIRVVFRRAIAANKVLSANIRPSSDIVNTEISPTTRSNPA